MSISIFIIVGFGAIAIMSMVMHEYAHGYVASVCGDHTAEALGRLTLNPLKHIDPFMTIILPVALLLMGAPPFGGAKPVPVNPYNLRNYRRDNRLVSAAGVVTNLLIAIGLSVVLHVTLRLGVFTMQPVSSGAVVLGMGIIINLVLFAFNLMPIPPLDGSRLLRSFLPPEMEALFNKLDRFGIILVFLLLSVLGPIVVTAVLLIWHYVLQFGIDDFLTVYKAFEIAVSFGG